MEMSKKQEAEEIRWQVIKSMLEEFPSLKQKTKTYLDNNHDSKK
jgi:hypothetical protein